MHSYTKHHNYFFYKMNLEVKHFEMLIDTLNYALRQLYYIFDHIKYYDDLIDNIEEKIETIIFPKLCKISKQTGLSIQMLKYRWFDSYMKQITPNTLSDKFWSECSDADDEK